MKGPEEARDAGEGRLGDSTMGAVYAIARHLAIPMLRCETRSATLQLTAVLNEACKRVIEYQGELPWTRSGLVSMVIRNVRFVLVDRARKRGSVKHGAEFERHDLAHVDLPAIECVDVLLVDLDDALTRLKLVNEQHSAILEAKYFGGLTDREIGELLSISTRTVARQREDALEWLRTALGS